MEKIRLFVDNLFYGLPHDRRTSQLKEDLLAELESRYQGIAAQVPNENEAFGILVSECGSLEERLRELEAPSFKSRNVCNGDCNHCDCKWRHAAAQRKPAAQQRSLASSLNSLVMMLATIYFLLSGFVWGVWHPAWVVFPVGAIVCAIISTLFDLHERKKAKEQNPDKEKQPVA